MPAPWTRCSSCSRPRSSWWSCRFSSAAGGAHEPDGAASSHLLRRGRHPLSRERIGRRGVPQPGPQVRRSEEHTSELQSRLHLVCRLLLEKKKKKNSRKLRDKKETTWSRLVKMRRGCI